MKLNKKDKQNLSQELAKEFKAKDTFFASFNGLKFKESNTLRDSLRPVKSRFKVMRNTIVSHALENASLKAGDEALVKGPTAVVTLEDPNEITRVAKELMAFAKANSGVKWKGGFYSQKWLTPADIRILARRKIGISHNPESNMKLASGTAPVPAMRAAGIHVGLGTDGAASNNDLDMFEAMRQTAFLHKLQLLDSILFP